jgi:hypothetical protein
MQISLAKLNTRYLCFTIQKFGPKWHVPSIMDFFYTLTWSRASFNSADCWVPARTKSRLESCMLRSFIYSPARNIASGSSNLSKLLHSLNNHRGHCSQQTLFYYFCSQKVLLIHLFSWLIIYCFTSRSRIFHLHEDVTIASEGLQNLGLCSALRAFEQEGIFIVPHLLWHGTFFCPVSSEGPPHSVNSYDTHGDAEDLFQPESSWGHSFFVVVAQITMKVVIIVYDMPCRITQVREMYV